MEHLEIEKAFQLMSPLPYTMVTTLDETNTPNVLGVAWVTRVSWNQFLLMISIDKKRYSYAGIKLNKEFVVNYPSKEQKEHAGSTQFPPSKS